MINIFQVTACIAAVLMATGVFSISTVIFHFLNQFVKVKDISWIFGLLTLFTLLSLVASAWRFL